MKKKFSLALAMTVVVSAFSALTAAAAPAYYTDVNAYINNNAVQSYTIDNHTVVSTETLKSFGFCVEWDSNARAVYINKDLADGAITGTWNPAAVSPFVENYKAYAPGDKTTTITTPAGASMTYVNKQAGDVAFTTVPSDIKVYVKGILIDSYAGQVDPYTPMRTWVKFADVAKATCSHSKIQNFWLAQQRTAHLTISSEPQAWGVPAVPSRYLTYNKALEIAERDLAASIIGDDAVVVPANSWDAAAPSVAPYTFAIDFLGDEVVDGCTITVAQNGDTTIVIPEWLFGIYYLAN